MSPEPRALARPFARPLAWEPVLQLYKETPDYDESWFKDGLAVALSGMASQSDLDVLINLIDDRANGRTRIFFLRNLSRSRNPVVINVLMRHVDDQEIAPEIKYILGKKMKKKPTTKDTLQ